jgi:hypothetical protein
MRAVGSNHHAFDYIIKISVYLHQVYINSFMSHMFIIHSVGMRRQKILASGSIIPFQIWNSLKYLYIHSGSVIVIQHKINSLCYFRLITGTTTCLQRNKNMQRHEAVHSPPSSTHVKNDGAIPTLPTHIHCMVINYNARDDGRPSADRVKMFDLGK